MVHVPVFCTADNCRAERYDHIHQPTPCRNGKDARHHDFAPPRSVAIAVEGRIRRVKVPA